MSFQKKFYSIFIILLLIAGVNFTACGGGGGGNTPASSTSKQMLTFGFASPASTGVIDETTKTISVRVPYKTDVTKLAAVFSTNGEKTTVAGTEQTSGTTENNFTGDVIYRVTAGDGSYSEYTVTVTVAESDEKDITAFTIEEQAYSSIHHTSISVIMPAGSAKTNLTPAITHTGASVSPGTGGEVDFTNPVKYTVTAADNTQKEYTVTVTVVPESAKETFRFSIMGIDAIIRGTLITIILPHGTDITSLVPVIKHCGVSISPESGTAVDFSQPVPYILTASDGTIKTYTVNVNTAAIDSKDITAFSINGIAGTINGTAVTVTLPYGTVKTSLVPQITHTGTGINPVPGVATDFTGPVDYTVTAADGSTKQYTVTVNIAPESAKEITRFSIQGVDGTINGTDIILTVPSGSDRTFLVPVITHTGESISPASGVPQDFTNPVVYTVTGADKSQKPYTVTVNVAPFSWVKTITDTKDNSEIRVCTDRSGNVYTTGDFSGTADFGGITVSSKGGRDAFIAKYSPEGTCLWIKTMGGSDINTDKTYGNSIAIDTWGNIYATGWFLGAVNIDGISLANNGKSDIYIAKFDMDGKLAWVKAIGGTGSDFAHSLCTDRSGNVIVTGEFDAPVDFGGGSVAAHRYSICESFVAKYSPNGDFIWVNSTNSSGQKTPLSVCTDSNDNVYISGWFNSKANFGGTDVTSKGEMDIFIVKYSSDGTFRWQKAIGDTSCDMAASICADASDNIYVAGSFVGSVDFGNGIVTSTGESGQDDIFIVKYDADGAYVWANTMGANDSDTCYAVCTDTLGNVYATGYFSGAVDFGGGNSITSKGASDIFIAKYLAADGTFQQVKNYGGEGSAVAENNGYSICVDSSGNAYASGIFKGTVDFDADGETSGGDWDYFIIRN